MVDDRPFVTRPADLAALETAWASAKAGTPQFVRLVAPFGGGRRALVSEFQRQLRTGSDDAVVWQVSSSDQENGLQWLMRAYGSLVAGIAGDVLLRGKVEMVLNAALPSETKRVQAWFQAFTGSLKEAKPDPQTGQLQLRIPQDNPLLALIETVRAISRKIPVVLDVQLSHLTHSMVVPQLLEALMEEVKDGGRLLAVLHDEPEGDVRNASHPAPLIDLYARRKDAFTELAIAPWGAEEVATFLRSKGLTGNAARIAEIADGRPGFVSELTDILAEQGKLEDALEGVSLASLVPMTIDEDELSAPDAPAEEGQRKHATAADADQIAFLAALLGQAFPSALLAEMGGYDHSSVDDLIDAMEDLYDEVQYNEQMQTWIYRFKRGSWREGILQRNATEEGRELARRVGVFMERYLAPRGLAFINRTARIYAENGAPNRAQQMRAMALTGDDPNSWGLCYELMKYFDEVPWTDAARRTVYMTLLDHLATSGQLNAADRVHTEVTEWATQKEDRDLQAWLLLNGSKLDLRRQDLYRARDRARDALKLFEALGNKVRIAEVHTHLASIALADGKPEEALQEADAALTTATTEDTEGRKVVAPTTAAQAELIRGAVARRSNKLQEAIEHFQRANQIAGQTGLGPLALDAGIAMGEAMLAARQVDQAAQVLERVLVAAQQLGASPRERQAAEMLAQAEGARRNFPQALALAQRVLQLSQQLNMPDRLPVDLYNVGFFLLATGKGAEAFQAFQQAEQRLGDANHPIRKDLSYYAGVAAVQAKQVAAGKPYLDKAIALLRNTDEAPKLASALDARGVVAQTEGDGAGARAFWTEAMQLAEKAGLKDARRQIAKKIEQLG